LFVVVHLKAQTLECGALVDWEDLSALRREGGVGQGEEAAASPWTVLGQESHISVSLLLD